MSVRYRAHGRSKAVLLVAIAILMMATSCGGADDERSAIRVQGPSVHGDVLVIDDLGDTDTVLWFWAPW